MWKWTDAAIAVESQPGSAHSLQNVQRVLIQPSQNSIYNVMQLQAQCLCQDNEDTPKLMQRPSTA